MLYGLTQLILDIGAANLILPESRKGGYTAEYSPLSEDVEMATGRMVLELRGNVWIINYQYGYFQDEMKNKVISVCQKGRRTPITCAFLPPDSDGTLSQSLFWVTKFAYPKFYWGRNDHGKTVPLWGDFSLTLREVEPSD